MFQFLKFVDNYPSKSDKKKKKKRETRNAKNLYVNNMSPLTQSLWWFGETLAQRFPMIPEIDS